MTNLASDGATAKLLRGIFRGLLDNEEYREYKASEERGFQMIVKIGPHVPQAHG